MKLTSSCEIGMGQGGWAIGMTCLVLALLLATAGCDYGGEAKSGDGSADPFAGLGEEVSVGDYRFCPPKNLPRRELPRPSPSIELVAWSEAPLDSKPTPTLLLVCAPTQLDLTKEPPHWERSASDGLKTFKRRFKDFKQFAGNRLRINGLEAYRTEFMGEMSNSVAVSGVVTVFVDDKNALACVAIGLGSNAGDAVASMEKSIMTVKRPGYVPPKNAIWDAPPGAIPGRPLGKTHLDMIRTHGLDKIAVISVVDLPFGVTPSQRTHIATVIREAVGPKATSFVNVKPDECVVGVAPVDDIAKLAGNLDLGQVTAVDEANRSFTLRVDPDKLPSFMELAEREMGGMEAEYGSLPGMRSKNAPVISPDDPNFFKQNLADLKSSDFFRQEKALNRLVSVDVSKLTDPEMRKEVAQAMREVAFNDSAMPNMRSVAVRGLVHWGGKFSGPLLVQLLVEDDHFLNDEVYKQLAIVKEPTAIDPLVAKLMGFDSENAAKCLAAFGPAAEDSVLANTRADNFITSRTVVQLLAKIGTKKSLPALKSLRQLHFYNLIAGDVQYAVQAIEQREKATPKPQE